MCLHSQTVCVCTHTHTGVLPGTTSLFAAAQAHKLRFPDAAAPVRRLKPLGLAGAVTVSETDSLAFVLHTMVHNHVHRVFVVDDARVAVGVISAFDLLRELVGKMNVPEKLRKRLGLTPVATDDGGEDESKA